MAWPAWRRIFANIKLGSTRELHLCYGPDLQFWIKDQDLGEWAFAFAFFTVACRLRHYPLRIEYADGGWACYNQDLNKPSNRDR